MKTKKTLAIIGVVLFHVVFVVLVIMNASPAVPAVSEREALLNAMHESYEANFKKLNEAETQIEMTMAAGRIYSSAKPFLAKAAEYRLSRLETPEERLALLEEVFDAGDAVRRIFDGDSDGSAAGMVKSLEAAGFIVSRASVWLMEDDEYRDWMKWTDLALELDGKTIRMKDGSGTYTAKPYDEYVDLSVSFGPGSRFSCNGKDYAIVTMDLDGSFNTDYLQLHLFRLDPVPASDSADKPDDDEENDDSFKPAGVLRQVRQLDTFLYRSHEVKGNKLILKGEKTHSGGPYEATIELPE